MEWKDWNGVYCDWSAGMGMQQENIGDIALFSGRVSSKQ